MNVSRSEARAEPFEAARNTAVAARGIRIRIAPAAAVLPCNILRFYLHFSRPAEALFERSRLSLLDQQGRTVRDPFLVFSEELWSADGRRLTVLMEPSRIKRGMGTGPFDGPALVAGRSYALCLMTDAGDALHRFRAADAVRRPLDERCWRIVAPRAGSLHPATVVFDRVVDSVLCMDEVQIVDPAGVLVDTRASLGADGRSLEIHSNRGWVEGNHRAVFSSRFEDVCGNRLGEALDHHASESDRPRCGTLSFEVQRSSG